MWELELLLFLSRASESMTAMDIAKRMYVSPQAVDIALGHFVKEGLACLDNPISKSYIYSPRTEELRESVKQCSRAYAEQRVNVIEMIFSSPIQSFADAFKLGLEREED